jgi:hypothetical protein
VRLPAAMASAGARTATALPRLLYRHISCFFLGQQLREALPLGVIFGFSKAPFEDTQFLAVYKFFHGVLL